MEITDRARNLWSWISGAIEGKNDAEIVSHIALAFIDERKIAFADHGSKCLKVIETQAMLCRPNSEHEIKGGYIALHDAWLEIKQFSEGVSGQKIGGHKAGNFSESKGGITA